MTDFSFDGITIGQRQNDGYIDGTAMCQANGKKINDYLRLDSTKAYLGALSYNTGIPVIKLAEPKAGRYGNTWVHPKVAIHLGQWCNPEFAVWVTNLVFDWLQDRQPISRQASVADLIEGICEAKEHLRKTEGAICALDNALDFGIFADVWNILRARISKASEIATNIISI